ncbi:MAG: hypothetical protein ACREUC_04955, partial [Steroidobacteraceae bacterium]
MAWTFAPCYRPELRGLKIADGRSSHRRGISSGARPCRLKVGRHERGRLTAEACLRHSIGSQSHEKLAKYPASTQRVFKPQG